MQKINTNKFHAEKKLKNCFCILFSNASDPISNKKAQKTQNKISLKKYTI